MTTDMNSDQGMNDGMSQRAVSLYGQGDAMDDFPVLKAFQQYVDAEQEKARKRILTISVFFGIFLLAVIAVFMVILQNINARNQALSDRLVDYAMKEAERRQETPPSVVQPAPRDDAAFKAITDTLVSLQKQVTESRQAQPASATKVDEEEDRKVRQERERLLRERERLAAEKARLEAEKERLHQIEVDRQRRKLYPELYGEKPAQKQTPAPATPAPAARGARTLTDEDIREIIREAYPDGITQDAGEKRASAGKKPARKVEPEEDEEEEEKEEKASGKDEDVDEAIEYFKDDEYKIPVDIKGKPVKFSLPVQ